MTDYDQTDLPAAYDRARDHGPELQDLWMGAIAAHLENRSITRILDLGCGTGRFSEGLAARFNAEVIGVDPSVKMLELARAKQRDGRVHYQQGRAEAIPLEPKSVDLVFMSMSLHHFAERTAAARECRRVLRDKGTVVIRTGVRERIESYPYVPFFRSIRPILEDVLLSRADIRDAFATAGLHMVASETITQTIAPDWMTYAEKLAMGGDSVLARLSRQEFEDGLKAVREYAGKNTGQAVTESIDLFVLR